MNINLVPDNSVGSAPSGFTAAIQAAAQVFDQDFPGNYTVNIRYGWGTYDNAADDVLTNPNSGAFSLGGVIDDASVSYATMKSWLTADASTSDQKAALASLPATPNYPVSPFSFNGGPVDTNIVQVSSAQEKALGKYSGSPSTIDGSIGFNVDDATASPAELEEGALAEIAHALGMLSGDEPNYAPTILDFYRYSSPGVYQWTGGQPAYFSIDGGKTDIARYDDSFDPTLFKNLGANEPFNVPFEVTAAKPTLTSLDIEVMNLLGFGGQPPAASPPQLAITSTDAGADPTTETVSGAIDAADAGRTVSIFDGGTLLGTTAPDASGDWSRTVDLPAGTQSVTARASNSEGAGTSNAVVFGLQPASPPAYSILTVTAGGGLTIGTGNGDVKLFDLSGGDTLAGGSGREALHVFSGDNSLLAGSGLDTLFGGSGDDTLMGAGQSRMNAGTGDEKLFGGSTAAANDTLRGSLGDDTLSVTMGNNRLIAGPGHAVLRGGSGNDTLLGGAGPDTLVGGVNSLIRGGSASETIRGSAIAGSSDTIFAGSGGELINSQAGDDSITNGIGFDTIRAGSGADTIDLTSGTAAKVFGGSGAASIIVGMTGDDTITGGAGASTVFTEGGSSTDPETSSTFNAVTGYTEITFASDQVLTVKGVTVDFAGGGVIHT